MTTEEQQFADHIEANFSGSKNASKPLLCYSKNETQIEIDRYEAIVKDLQLKVQMTNQDIKSNKAKIAILKEFLQK